MITLKDYTLAEVPALSGARFGLRPALSMVGGAVYTYRDFERITGAIAGSLIAEGVKKGDRVAILAENSPHWVMTYFGIVRAGAVVVPILTDFIPTQIYNILEHAEARIVCVSEKLRAKLTALPNGTVVRDIRQSYAPPASPVLLPDVAADDLAMIVYTSGTTGLSKGVMLTHRNILSNATACKSIISLHRTDRLLSLLPRAPTYDLRSGQ
jgi:long-chain acyl-CoA synthetase